MPQAKPTWVFRYPKSRFPDMTHSSFGATFAEAITDWPNTPEDPIEFVRKEWQKYAWPGGYPLYYVTKDNGCLCSTCANENMSLTHPENPEDGDSQWQIELVNINYEDTTLYCDNCYEFIESAYGEESENE